MMANLKTIPIIACVLGVLLMVGGAFATATPATANIIQVEATSSNGSATFEEVFPVGSFDGILAWSLPAPLTLSDGEDLAVLQDLAVQFNADPQVDLSFACTNSSLTEPVRITITTATVVFTPVPNAEAAATASVTMTQGAGSPAGVYVTGMFPDEKMYQARYSTDPILNTKTVFANLDDSMSHALGASMTQYMPAVGFAALGTTVHMMEAEYDFILSPGDQASGTSAFLIIPEPASLSMLVIGLVLVRRRR